MNRLFLVMAVLLLSLSACGGGGAGKTPLSPAGAGSPVAGEKIGEDVVGSAPVRTDEREPEEEPVEAGALLPAPAGDPVAGEKLFAGACVGCHGQEMSQSEFVAAQTDQELVEFIRTGGVPDEAPVMPPRGGNPTLNDEKLLNIVAYLRSLQK